MGSHLTVGEFLSESDLEALRREPGQALGLPGTAYLEGFFALEQRTIFPRSWCAIAFASDIPEPGDAMPVELGGWPLILVRTQDGSVRAFHNVCRHRGMRILAEPCRALRNFVCPWHSWTYDLEGQCVATPRIGGQRAHQDPDFDCTDVDLRPVATAVWLDMVFVNISGDAPDFKTHIRPLDELLSAYERSAMQVGNGWSMDFSGNWKITVEGALEDYHLPFVHSQFGAAESDGEPRLDHAAGCYFANSLSCELSEVAVAADSDLPVVYRSDDGKVRTFAISVFPTGFITARPNQLICNLMLPCGHDKTHLEFRHYYAGDAATDPALESSRRKFRGSVPARVRAGPSAGGVGARQLRASRRGRDQNPLRPVLGGQRAALSAVSGRGRDGRPGDDDVRSNASTAVTAPSPDY